jgi:hypothetical protein
MSSDRRSSIYGLFKKPGSSGSNNTTNNNDDDRALKRTRTNSTASTTPSSAATPARQPTTSLSPVRRSPSDRPLVSPSRPGLSTTQSFSPIQEHPGKSPLDEKVKSPFLSSRKHSDRPQHGTAQSFRRQDSVRKDTTSTLRSMTLGHGGHVHDVPVNPRSSLQLLQDTSTKRIATLDYLRRTYVETLGR